MRLEEIMPGMVFKENDNRFVRYIKISRVEGEKIFFIASADDKFILSGVRKEYVSKKPGRFHRFVRSKGYSLVKISDTEVGKQ